MNADANALEYWTPSPRVASAALAPGPAASMFTGPDRVGCATMLAVVAVSSVLALAIVAGLSWVLA